MKAIILAAGEGTRLGPMTANRPKVILPIFNKPLLQYNIELLKRNGIDEVVINLHHHPSAIRDYLGDGRAFNMKITYSYEKRLLGTAGAIKKVADSIKGTTLLLYGDNFINASLKKIVKYHTRQKGMMTIALMRGLDPTKCGIAALNENGRVIRFKEKPRKEEVFSDLINAGIYVFEPEVLEFIPEGAEFDFGKDLIPHLIKNGEGVFGQMIEGYLFDIGIPSQYLRVHRDIFDGKTGIEVPGNKMDGNVWLGEGVVIHSKVKFSKPVFAGDSCIFGRNVQVKGCSVFGSDCFFDRGSSISGCMFGKRTRVGKYAIVAGSIIGNDCSIGDGVTVQEGTIIGDNCRIGNHVMIKKNVRIWPNQTVKSESVIDSDLR